MSATAVQASLRRAFEQWGRPLSIRFDNGAPWANPRQRGVPTGLALWLCGLGIQPVFGRPRRSTDNAVVERCHGVLNAWVEPTRCTSRDHLAAELQAQALVQRSLYPACQGQPRLHAFPALLNRPRPYQALREAALWQLDHVLTYLARFTFSRKVEKNGRITLLAHELSIGRAFRAQTVTVRLDPAAACWLVQDRDGVLLKSLPASLLDYPTIASLLLTFRHFKASRKAKLIDASPGGHPYSV